MAIEASVAATRSRRRSGGSRRGEVGDGGELHPAEAEGGALADVEDLGGAEEGGEGGEVAGDFELADEAAQAHLASLPVAVSLPIVPAQARGRDVDGAGGVEQGTEAPIDRCAGDVEVGQLEG